MNMIERVSNAIRDSFNSNDVDCIQLAKVAIQAMREPTKEMKKQWNDEFADGHPYWQAFCEMNWDAGIDAALKE